MWTHLCWTIAPSRTTKVEETILHACADMCTQAHNHAQTHTQKVSTGCWLPFTWKPTTCGCHHWRQPRTSGSLCTASTNTQEPHSNLNCVKLLHQIVAAHLQVDPLPTHTHIHTHNHANMCRHQQLASTTAHTHTLPQMHSGRCRCKQLNCTRCFR